MKEREGSGLVPAKTFSSLVEEPLLSGSCSAAVAFIQPGTSAPVTGQKSLLYAQVYWNIIHTVHVYVPIHSHV